MGHWIVLCVLLAAPFAGRADDSIDDTATDAAAVCEAAHAELPHGTLLDLLDPKAPADRRADALAAYQRLATLEQCPEFGYTLGQLYRHGSYLPGNLVAQDVAKARELIRPMAEDGYLPAFADLAEMEMRHANARKAMKWTQVYLHFVQDVKLDYLDEPEAVRYQKTAYNLHLLARTEFVWRHLADPPLPRELIDEDLDAYLAEHKDHVARRMRARMEGQETGPTRVAGAADDCYVNAIEGVGSAAATWIVEVLPSGETGRIVLENFVPNPEAARKMQACVSDYAFAPLESDQPTTVRIPMVLGSTGSRGLRRR